MNNYYALIYLTAELKENLNQVFFTGAYSIRKNRLDMYFLKDNEPVKLSVSVEPGKTALFLDHYSPPKISNAARIFEHIEGAKAGELRLAEGDRLITLDLDSGEQIYFQLYGNSANIFIVNDGVIKSTFKHQKKYNGRKAPEARKPTVRSCKDIQGNARQRLITINPLLPRNLLPDLIDYFKLETLSGEQLEAFAGKLHQVLMHEAVPGVLPDGRLCLLPDEFFPVPGKKVFESFNDAVRSAYYFKSHLQRFEAQKKRLLKQLEKQQEKLQKRLYNLADAGKSLERSGRYEKYGHLIMANLHNPVEPESEEVRVEDLYDEGNTISIPIRKTLGLSGNAAMYYEKSREAKKAYETAGVMRAETERNLKQVDGFLDELREIDSLKDLEKWTKAHHRELQATGAGQKEGEQARHPYRKLEAAGYELWIGKSAKSNDELLRDSHKEDIWLHARGYAGSHVIIRMEKKADFPDKHVLGKAASYAAKYSKGAASGLVPVIYAKRKHVRKPKGAPPGQVKVDMEKVILTEPKEGGN